MRNVLLALSALALSACGLCPVAPAPQVRVIDSGCRWVVPMSASESDTDATKREIIAYEQARQANCRNGSRTAE